MTDAHFTLSRKVIKSQALQKWIKVNIVPVPPTQKLKDKYPCVGSQPAPSISMQGKWLDQVGFPIDQPVKVRAMEGCIVLTAETPPPPESMADGN